MFAVIVNVGGFSNSSNLHKQPYASSTRDACSNDKLAFHRKWQFLLDFEAAGSSAKRQNIGLNIKKSTMQSKRCLK